MIEQRKGQLEIRCKLLSRLFNDLMATNSRVEKENIIWVFRKKYPKMEKDLDFCFEVLAGYHKLGYTYLATEYPRCLSTYGPNENVTVRHMVNVLKTFSSDSYGIGAATAVTPPPCRRFIERLVNRRYKLGYSNKKAMVTNLSPMLAKKYPESHHESYYYIQEKLDGNRCIATYIDAGEMSPEGVRSLKGATEGKWFFYSRSGKVLKVDFDMSWADKNYCYDGEIMTLGKAGTRDFNRTSGAINSKYGDKSQLHYFIYDVIIDDLTYESRWEILRAYTERDTNIPEGVSGRYNMSVNVSILPVLDKVFVWPNPEYNHALDKWLDYIVDKGGEGIILRDPAGYYEHKRTNALLKYKKTQTCDLRVIGWNEGKGKNAGGIGSFVCETDNHAVRVNVGGLSDSIIWSDPNFWIGKIIEVAYFDQSKSSKKDSASLRFPRFKKLREDKDETSIY